MKTLSAHPRSLCLRHTAPLVLLSSLLLAGCEIDLREGKYTGTVSGTKTDANGTVEISNGGASMIIELVNDMPGNRADSYIFRLCEDLLPKRGTEGCGAAYTIDVDDNAFSHYYEYWQSYDYQVTDNGYTYYGYCYYYESIALTGAFTNDHQVEFTFDYSTRDDTDGCRDLVGVPYSMSVEGVVSMN